MRPNSTSYLTRAKFSIFLALCFFCLATTVVANPADLDPFFGNSGIVRSSPDGSNGTLGVSMALQADGKIVMTAIPTPSTAGFLVARYNPDGSLDTTFDVDGWVMAVFSGQDVVNASAIDVQPDGKIVVGGTIGNASPNWQFAIARFNADGTPDNTFDGDGQVIVDFTNIGGFESLTTLKVRSDGKIMAAGYTGGEEGRFLFVRLNSDGSPDSTFGINGKFVDATTSGPGMHDMLIRADGTFVIVGWRINQNGSFRFARKFNASGTGQVWTYQSGVPNTGGGEVLHGIVETADGKFIVVGDKARMAVALRLNADGTQDNTFASPSMPQGYFHAVALQSDGKIVANINFAAGSSFSLVRYLSNGSLDTSFGAGGIATIIGGYNGQDVIVQPDGKILVGGWELTGTERYVAIARYRGGNFVADRAAFDYDGDNKSDVSVYRPSSGVWYLNQSTNGFTAVQWGNSTDRIAPADYDGDNKTDIAIYRNGEWWILQSSDATVKILTFGIAEDKPQPGDYDGDGKDDQAVFRPSTGVWYMFRSSDNGYSAIAFGVATDIPQRGDYDDDGKCDIAIFRPSNGTWYVQKSLGGGYLIVQFGTNGDVPVAADYDGDSKPDFAVWRQSNGDWWILKSSNLALQRTNFGLAADLPVPADYNGDGRADIAIYRTSTGVWYQLLSPSGTWAEQVFGLSGDRPTQGAYGP